MRRVDKRPMSCFFHRFKVDIYDHNLPVGIRCPCLRPNATMTSLLSAKQHGFLCRSSFGPHARPSEESFQTCFCLKRVYALKFQASEPHPSRSSPQRGARLVCDPRRGQFKSDSCKLKKYEVQAPTHSPRKMPPLLMATPMTSACELSSLL